MPVHPRRPVADEDRLALELKMIRRRLEELEIPDGIDTAWRREIRERVTALEASVAGIPALVNQRVNAAIAAAFAGAVTITGSLTVNGALAAASLTTAGALATSGAVTLPGARGTTVPSGAVAAVFDASGKLGRAA